MDFIADNNARYRKHAKAFERMFGCKLKPFFDSITGFDVIKFDEEFVKPVAGEACSEAVERRWGKEAMGILRLLLGMPQEA